MTALPRVLVTGGTGAVGRGVLRGLRGRAQVVAMARRRPDDLPADVEFVAADICDADAVRRAVKGCDTVVHLAWAVSVLLSDEETTAINVGGTRNVLDAVDDAGVGRLVFCSSVTAYGPMHERELRLDEAAPLRPDPTFLYALHKAQMEREIEDRGIDAVRVRLGTVLGRRVDNSVARAFTGPVLPGIAGRDMAYQFVHQDDVGRFFAAVALGGPTGPVNFCDDQVVSMREIAEVMHRRYFELPEAVVARLLGTLKRLGASEVDPNALAAMAAFPLVDTTRLRDEFGFRCAWSSREAIEDMARAGTRWISVGPRVVDLPWRLPYVDPELGSRPPSDGAPVATLLPPDAAGEQDTPLDPRFPEFTSTNVSEAFPGPMTPLTLDVALHALRASAAGICHIFGFRGPVAEEIVDRGPVSIGHRMYTNISATRQMAEHIPGMTRDDIDHQYLGTAAPTQRPPVRAAEVAQAAVLAARGGMRLAALGREADRAQRDADELAVLVARVADVPDERLLALADLLHDQLVQAWNVACIMNLVAGGAWSLVEQRIGYELASAVQGDPADLASARTVLGVHALAGRARHEPAVADLLRSSAPSDAVGQLDRVSPPFADAFRTLVRDVGHRGPGETELANPVFADRPELLLGAIAKAIDSEVVARRTGTPPHLKTVDRVLTKVAVRQTRTRERARDAAMRITHLFRQVVRERGRRLAAAGVLDSPDDAVFLTLEELRNPPPDATTVVRRRRDERARLAALVLPGLVSIGWEPQIPHADVRRELTGIPASPGTVRGVARVLDDAHDLEPGEILVCKVTDVGWTAVFGYAAAVVTDLGGSMSHAAVVARELGVPCVVGTQDATSVIRDGQLVEVDGTAGVVRLVDEV